MISTTRSPFRPLALFMGVMTLVWASNAAAAAPVPAALLALLGLAVIVGAATMRRAGDRSPVARNAPRSAPSVPIVTGRTAGLLALVEVIGILVTVLLLARSGLGELVMPAVAVVVAAHFALFLRVQRSWLHLVTSVLGVLGAGSALVLMAVGALDPSAGRAVAGLSLAACTALYGIVFCALVPAPVRSVAARS